MGTVAKGLWYWIGLTALPFESWGCGHRGAATILRCGPKDLVDAKACSRRGSGARTMGMGGAYFPQPFHQTWQHLLWDPGELLCKGWNCDTGQTETDGQA